MATSTGSASPKKGAAGGEPTYGSLLTSRAQAVRKAAASVTQSSFSMGGSLASPASGSTFGYRPVARTLDFHSASARPASDVPGALENPSRRPPGHHVSTCDVARHKAIDRGARLEDPEIPGVAEVEVGPRLGRGEAVYQQLAGMPTYQQTPRKKAHVDCLDHLNHLTPVKNRTAWVKAPAVEMEASCLRWRQDRRTGAPIDQRSRIPQEDVQASIADHMFSGAAGKGSLDLPPTRGKRSIPTANTMVDEIVFGHQMAEPVRRPGEQSRFPTSISGHDVNHIHEDVHRLHDDSAGWRSWVEPSHRCKRFVDLPEAHTSRSSFTHLPFTKRRYMPDNPMATSYFDNVVLGRDTNHSGEQQYHEMYNRQHDGAAGTPSWYNGDRELRCLGVLDTSTYTPPHYSVSDKEKSGCPAEIRTHSPRTWTHAGRGQHPFGHQVDWWPKIEEQQPWSATLQAAADRGGDQNPLRREQAYESPAGLNARNLGIRSLPKEHLHVESGKRQYSRTRSEPPKTGRHAGLPSWVTSRDYYKQWHGPHGPFGFRPTGDNVKLVGNPHPEAAAELPRWHHLAGYDADGGDRRRSLSPHSASRHSDPAKRVGNPSKHFAMTDGQARNRPHSEHAAHIAGSRAKLEDRGRSSSTACVERARSSSTTFGRSCSRGLGITRSPSAASNRSWVSATSVSSRRGSGVGDRRRGYASSRDLRPR